ncbi:uncharacterized protein LOC126648051 isoform X3 [Myiozetetes cayanensis]|uniref:uncharacterized protein LOC126648051 isoform X3 n=1 Tax=Myiozetetes cayanensis TaxID=478635 RepID=UPI0021606E17|nr:uncharacterized protein LOC126648051 isoform X3 [Myiozetetes cayanensis]
MPWRTRLNSSTNSSSLPSSEITRGSWRGWRPPQGSAPLSVNPCGIPWELQPGHVCLPRLLLARLGTGQDLGRSCVVPSARALVQSKEREFYCIPRNCSNSCGLAPAFSGSATNPPPERFAALAVGAGVRSSWRCLLSLCSVPALPSVPWPRRSVSEFCDPGLILSTSLGLPGGKASGTCWCWVCIRGSAGGVEYPARVTPASAHPPRGQSQRGFLHTKHHSPRHQEPAGALHCNPQPPSILHGKAKGFFLLREENTQQQVLSQLSWPLWAAASLNRRIHPGSLCSCKTVPTLWVWALKAPFRSAESSLAGAIH